MRTIMVLNTKGGTGKTTLVTNIAGYYASQEMSTVVKDYDSQGSAIDWIEQRDGSLSRIHSLAAFKSTPQFATRAWQNRLPKLTERVVIDTPAKIDLERFINTMRSVDKIVIPVSSSAIEIRVTVKFVHKLRKLLKSYAVKAEIGLVAIRVDINTTNYHAMQATFNELDIEFIASLSYGDNYLKSAESGVGILEMESSQLAKDKFEWAPLINWLEDDVVIQQNSEERKFYVVSD